MKWGAMLEKIYKNMVYVTNEKTTRKRRKQLYSILIVTININSLMQSPTGHRPLRHNIPIQLLLATFFRSSAYRTVIFTNNINSSNYFKQKSFLFRQTRQQRKRGKSKSCFQTNLPPEANHHRAISYLLLYASISWWATSCVSNTAQSKVRWQERRMASNIPPASEKRNCKASGAASSCHASLQVARSWSRAQQLCSCAWIELRRLSQGWVMDVLCTVFFDTG